MTRESKECWHYWQVDSKNKGVCEICEAEVQFPLEDQGKPDLLKKGTPLSNHRLNKFYQKHRSEILRDLDKIGRKKTIAQWHIPNSTMTILRQRWRPAVNPPPEESLPSGIPLTESPSPFTKCESTAPIRIVKQIPHKCFICEDNTSAFYLLDTPKGDLWLCDICTKGLLQIFEKLGIACVVQGLSLELEEGEPGGI